MSEKYLQESNELMFKALATISGYRSPLTPKDAHTLVGIATSALKETDLLRLKAKREPYRSSFICDLGILRDKNVPFVKYNEFISKLLGEEGCALPKKRYLPLTTPDANFVSLELVCRTMGVEWAIFAARGLETKSTDLFTYAVALVLRLFTASNADLRGIVRFIENEQDILPCTHRGTLQFLVPYLEYSAEEALFEVWDQIKNYIGYTTDKEMIDNYAHDLFLSMCRGEAPWQQ